MIGAEVPDYPGLIVVHLGISTRNNRRVSPVQSEANVVRDVGEGANWGRGGEGPDAECYGIEGQKKP